MNNAFPHQNPENTGLNFNSNLNFNSQIGDSSIKLEAKEKKKKKKKKKNKKKKDEGIVSPKEGFDHFLPETSFNIYALGEIKYAEMHRDANIPLKEIKKESQPNQIDFKSCPCCNSYLMTKGYLEPYSMCENPDNFFNCGQGVVLYYSFLKYIIFVTLIVSLCISCLNIFISKNVHYELTEVCNDIFEAQILGNFTNIKDFNECKYYFTDIPEDYPNITRVDSFLFRFSSVNIKDYRDLYYKNNINLTKNDSFEDTIINISKLNFWCLIFLFASNLFFIFFLFNKSRAADFYAFTVSDYSIFLYNLYDVHGKFLNIKKEINEKRENCMKTGKNYNADLYEKKKLGFKVDDIGSEIDQFKEFIKQKICKGNFNEDFKINRIDFSYKIGKLKEIQIKLEKKSEKISKIESFPEFEEKNKELKLQGDNRKYFSGFLDCCDSDDDKPISEIKQKKVNLENQITEIIEEAKKNTINYFGGAAFVTFDTVKEQELYMKNIPNNSIEYFFKFMRDLGYLFCSCCDKSSENIYYLKRNVKFEDAPEPEDIIFENLEVSSCSRLTRTIIIYITSLIICGISFIIIYNLNKLQIIIKEKDTSGNGHLTFLYVISLVISFVTSGIDVILEIIFQTFTEWEKHTTMTRFYLSYSIKLTIFTFLNSAVLPLIIELAFNQSEGFEILISNMLMKFLVNAFVTPIMWTLSVNYYLKKIQICLYDKKKLGSKTQKELNALYELPPMNVSAKYSYISKTLLMSFLYIPIFPLGVVISFLGFSIAYWLEKINFAHYYKKPEMLNKQICEFYVSYFVVVLFAYGVGDYLFLSDAYDTKIWSLLNIIVFGVLIIIPYHQLLSRDYININESEIYKKTYDDAYVQFNNDYERANPMTKQEGDIRFETAKKNKGLISVEQYEENIKYLNNRNILATFFKKRKNNFGRGFMGKFFQMPMNNNNNQPYQYNNQTNNIPINGPKIYNSKRITPQQMEQAKENKISFSPINNIFTPPPSYSNANYYNNANFNSNRPFQNNNIYNYSNYINQDM